MDDKHVIIRGYETGYPLKTIEAELANNLRLRQEQKLSHHLKIPGL